MGVVGVIGAGVADTIGYDAGIGEAAGAGVGTGASAGVSTGTNFGCDADAGAYTNDGSGGTELAGVAEGAPDFGATSVTRRSSGTFDCGFFWPEQPPATTHNNPIAMNVRVVTKSPSSKRRRGGSARESGTTRVATVYRESPRAAVKK